MIRNCIHCNKEFNVPPSKLKEGKGKYCSNNCRSLANSILCECLICKKKFRVGKARHNLGRGKCCSKECAALYTPKQKIVTCDYCGKDFKAKISELKRSKGKYCSRKCCHMDKSIKYCGENSSNWKGGTQRDKHNGDNRYSHWRLSVYERDNFTCQECGQVGGKLNAHHRFHWASFKSLRYEIWNGITLCEYCHKKEHRKKGEVYENTTKR